VKKEDEDGGEGNGGASAGAAAAAAAPQGPRRVQVNVRGLDPTELARLVRDIGLPLQNSAQALREFPRDRNRAQQRARELMAQPFENYLMNAAAIQSEDEKKRYAMSAKERIESDLQSGDFKKVLSETDPTLWATIEARNFVFDFLFEGYDRRKKMYGFFDTKQKALKWYSRGMPKRQTEAYFELFLDRLDALIRELEHEVGAMTGPAVSQVVNPRLEQFFNHEVEALQEALFFSNNGALGAPPQFQAAHEELCRRDPNRPRRASLSPHRSQPAAAAAAAAAAAGPLDDDDDDCLILDGPDGNVEPQAPAAAAAAAVIDDDDDDMMADRGHAPAWGNGRPARPSMAAGLGAGAGVGVGSGGERAEEERPDNQQNHNNNAGQNAEDESDDDVMIVDVRQGVPMDPQELATFAHQQQQQQLHQQQHIEIVIDD